MLQEFPRGLKWIGRRKERTAANSFEIADLVHFLRYRVIARRRSGGRCARYRSAPLCAVATASSFPISVRAGRSNPRSEPPIRTALRTSSPSFRCLGLISLGEVGAQLD